jgi:hypothetical protein
MPHRWSKNSVTHSGRDAQTVTIRPQDALDNYGSSQCWCIFEGDADTAFEGSYEPPPLQRERVSYESAFRRKARRTLQKATEA